MDKRTIHLINDRVRDHAKRMIDQAPIGYVLHIAEETRSDAQNRLMWPVIQDLQRGIPDLAEYSANDVKLRFLHALGQEMRFLPALEGAGMFPVGQRSSLLTKSQFSGLIELMFAYGAKHGVAWSARSEDTRRTIA
jgi:hypothetical protein